MLFICYTFLEDDGVAAFRSNGLTRFLREKGEHVKVIHKKSFFNKRIRFSLWSLLVFFKIIFSREKVVYVSCGPFTHLPMVYLSVILTRKKLVIDFRDPWSLNIKTNYGGGGTYKIWKYKSALFLEKIGYKLCSHFLVCTQGVFDAYSKDFKNHKKLFLMENGYDFNPKSIIFNNESEYLSAVCLGQFADYNYEKAKKAIIKLKKLSKRNKKMLKITLIGCNKEINEKLLIECEVLEFSNILPRMPYKEALKIASEHNCALLVIRDEDIDYGTKVYDYIALHLKVIDNFEENSKFRKRFKDIIIDDKLINLQNPTQNVEVFSRRYQYEKFYRKLNRELGEQNDIYHG